MQVTTQSQGNQLLDMSPSPGKELGSGARPEKPAATVTHVQAWDSTKESRLSYLARPKISHQINYNKVSVYWTDKVPSKAGRFTVPVLTARQEQLSQPKRICPGFEENRNLPSPEWPVGAASRHAMASPWVKELARPKAVSRAWEAERSVYTAVSEGARKAAPRERTIHLAKPKRRDFSACLNATSTPPPRKHFTRTKSLAKPKMEHPSYRHEKLVPWPVSAGAKKAMASARVSKLAHPRVRKHIFEGYDPYKVSSAAQHAQASPRLLELSTPRRLRTKHL